MAAGPQRTSASSASKIAVSSLVMRSMKYSSLSRRRGARTLLSRQHATHRADVLAAFSISGRGQERARHSPDHHSRFALEAMSGEIGESPAERAGEKAS